MLTKLKLSNFKRFSDFEIDFPAGLTLLTGPNFSGKSSVLHGILYALWGPMGVPGGKTVAVKRGESSAEVELGFDLNGHAYKIHRKGNNATLYEDGDVIAKSASVVTANVEALLGFDRKRFSQLKYGEQKKIENLLTLGATELHNIIEDVSQAGVVNDVLDKLRDVIRTCAGGIEAIGDQDITGLEESLKALTAELTERHAELEETKKLVQNAAEQRDTVGTTVSQAIAAEAERDQLRKELASINKEELELTSRKELAEKVVNNLYGSEAALQNLQMAVSNLLPEVEHASAQVQRLRSLERDVSLLNTRVKSTEEIILKAKADLEGHPGRQPIDGLEAKLQAAQDEVVLLRDRKIKLESACASKICPTCKRAYEDAGDLDELQDELVGDVIPRLANLELEIKEGKKRLKTATEMNSTLDHLNKIIVDNEAILEDQLTKHGMVALEYEELKGLDPDTTLYSLTGQGESLSEQVTELTGKVKQLTEAQTVVESVEQRQAAISKRKAEIGTVSEPVDLSPLQLQLVELEKGLKAAQLIYEEQTSSYAQKYGQWTALQKELEKAKQAEEHIQGLRARKKTAEGLGNYLRQNRDRFMGSVWDGVMAYASTFSSACTGGKIARLMRNESGSFSYIEEGEEAPIEAASGAQRSIMGLGVQLALAEMLPSKFPTLLLDEPTADADPERSLAMATLLSADSHQLIMVTHRELDGMVAKQVVNLEGEAA